MEDINIYISRILSGSYVFIHNNERYKLVYPSMYTKYLADLYAQDQYEKNKYNTWINDEDILSLLMDIGLWSVSKETELKQLPSVIEDTKIKLYKSYLNPKNVKTIKKSLNTQKKRLDFLYAARHSFDHVTIDGYVLSCKNQFILANSFYDMLDNKIFNFDDNINFKLFNNLCAEISNNTIPTAIFRKIARSDIWRNYWMVNKDNVFGKPSIEWTDEQKTLVMITKMYDNAYEHPECPSDSIIEDDDMFDGWMINLRKENEKEKNQRRTEKMLGDKLNKAGEIFLVAGSKEEANNIYELNTPQSRSIIKERELVISNSSSIIEDNHLPDVQRNLQLENIK